ncbi:hypothetical protein AVEN_141970-1 [Araneus ventricosus]|uniref:Uncharacterized protein n=1 Tax=Araneus ventricosus TaxID=182803 RepID=A0A4Y2ECK2_ARAVE|nr:hypothetical protein AVEN_141970-1 [Araneus ventricosus]
MGVILQHDNTHTARKTQELLQKCKEEVWGHPQPPMQPRLTPNMGSILLSGTRFSSNSDVKTASENCEHDFYQAGLNKLVLCLDECLNKFGDYVEK